MRQFLVKQNPKKKNIVAGPWVNANIVREQGNLVRGFAVVKNLETKTLELELETELPNDIIDFTLIAETMDNGVVLFKNFRYLGGFQAVVEVIAVGGDIQIQSVRIVGHMPAMFRGFLAEEPETNSVKELQIEDVTATKPKKKKKGGR